MKNIAFLSLLGSLLSLFPISQATACGGFFCEAVPVDQAGEQIVFHQQGNEITAMVRILYQGEAERFSWVVPVPTIPEISTGDDGTFDQLDLATRPQFLLQREGNGCPVPNPSPVASPDPDSPTSPEDGGVTVEETLSVGPFEIDILSSTNPEALANWLLENDYDLSDRGVELIAPYVADGMKFVAVKLRSGQPTGSIRPLIMKYQSDTPMIPIRLTAVAAQDDMGVLTWVVSDARAVPENYLHVIPNYTRLNWYAGANNAYVSYQSLITEAMNEAGGQGFATDMAGRINSELTNALPDGQSLRDFLSDIDSDNDATFLSNLIASTSSAEFQLEVSTALPLRPGEDNSIYFEPLALQANYTTEELANAREVLRDAYIRVVIEPIEESTALFSNGRYLTRLYTTLSADEMTVDPVFVYNNDMPDQSATREAKLVASCGSNGTEWNLTLGAGTGREGERVIDANAEIPFGAAPAAVSTQASTSIIERTSADAAPELVNENKFPTLALNEAAGSGDDDDDGFLGSLDWWWLLLLMGSLAWMRRD